MSLCLPVPAHIIHQNLFSYWEVLHQEDQIRIIKLMVYIFLPFLGSRGRFGWNIKGGGVVQCTIVCSSKKHFRHEHSAKELRRNAGWSSEYFVSSLACSALGSADWGPVCAGVVLSVCCFA